jgi:hypothetical protein
MVEKPVIIGAFQKKLRRDAFLCLHVSDSCYNYLMMIEFKFTKRSLRKKYVREMLWTLLAAGYRIRIVR